MTRKTIVVGGLLFLLIPVAVAQKPAGEETIGCRAMEVFQAGRLGLTAVIFHQRDKADGPRLGELLLAHSGEEVEFETRDGRWHSATLARMKSCFGRGLLLYAASEAKLTAGDDFVLRFSQKD
jgi:hypothetical protein